MSILASRIVSDVFKISALVAFSILPALANSANPAWNGHVPDNLDSLGSAFTPYYVPQGSVSVDNAHLSLNYLPKDAWITLHSADYVEQSTHATYASDATVTFTFQGTGIEWFGSMSNIHGIANVYIDGALIQSIDGFSSRPLKKQRLFGIDRLQHGTHNFQIKNTGQKRTKARGTWIDIDAFVVNPGVFDQPSSSLNADNPSLLSTLGLPRHTGSRRATKWNIIQKGDTGVNAMQLAIVSETHAIIIDKVEHNPLSVNGHPAWGSLYDLRTHDVRPLNIQSNSFCAGGTFLSNGTLVNIGGNPVVVDKTGAADFGDVNGIQAIRLFNPCSDGNCDVYENPHRIRLATPRWYNTIVRLDDGSAMVIGGSTRGGWINNSTTNNPTIEYFPPKNIHGQNGIPIHSPFLADTLNSNLFPISLLLPDGRVFVAANRDAMIYDWQANTEQRLPQIPNGVRVTYPMTGTGLLLPLTPSNSYVPTVLLCGGSTLDDGRPSYEMSSNEAASSQCSRMELSSEGIARGWETESMPQARVMPDSLILPDGRLLLVNGAQTGIAGYGNVRDQVGRSNADNPALTPVIYDPLAPPGTRFSTAEMPASTIPRMYHSSATLTPDGNIMIAGSNPNLDRTLVSYSTEYRVEWLSPDWISDGTKRPSFASALPSNIGYEASFEVQVDLEGIDVDELTVSLMDLGFVTHSVHMNNRLVILKSKLSDDRKTLTVFGPPSKAIYPPGPGWVYLVTNGVWSSAKQVMVGDGSGPPEDPGATENLLASTAAPSNTMVIGSEHGGEGNEAI